MATILRTEVKDDSWATFLRAEVRLDDGTVVWRQIEDHGRAAVVLPYDPQRRTGLLVQLFRAPGLYAGGSGLMVEAIAGIIDEGETAKVAARREAMEEAGVRLDALEFVGEVWTTPGISTERMSLYLAPYAAADRVSAGGGAEGEHENITVLERPLAELGAELEAGRVGDMKLLVLIQALRLRRPELFA
ncbi:NUDIX hydrolase [Caulobacter sp. S45]|uniref:NUDIX domain-containing protein n=1 Tax=Caulobacter sp. S45 TaxID=1641861 RepID=UPI0015774733|nr:NUDIX hydrolase [Caulobacter sp. S45]